MSSELVPARAEDLAPGVRLMHVTGLFVTVTGTRPWGRVTAWTTVMDDGSPGRSILPQDVSRGMYILAPASR